MTDLQKESLERTLEDLKAMVDNASDKISVKSNFIYYRPVDIAFEKVKEIMKL